MNLQELKNLSKLLKHAGMIDEERQTMELVITLPPPIYFFLDAVKIDKWLESRYDDFKDYNKSTKDYLIDRFGQEFWNKFESII